MASSGENGAAMQEKSSGNPILGGLELFFRSAFRAFHALWLEITGVFFLAFALAFVGAGAREYRQLGNGGSRLEIAGAACLALLFVYFAVTAFWRARRR